MLSDSLVTIGNDMDVRITDARSAAFKRITKDVADESKQNARFRG